MLQHTSVPFHKFVSNLTLTICDKYMYSTIVEEMQSMDFNQFVNTCFCIYIYIFFFCTWPNKMRKFHTYKCNPTLFARVSLAHKDVQFDFFLPQMTPLAVQNGVNGVPQFFLTISVV